MAGNNKIKLEIDLEPIVADIKKYVKRKVQQHIRDNYMNELIAVDIDFPDVHFPEIEKRLEALEDYIQDLKMGYTKLK